MANDKKYDSTLSDGVVITLLFVFGGIFFANFMAMIAHVAQGGISASDQRWGIASYVYLLVGSLLAPRMLSSNSPVNRTFGWLLVGIGLLVLALTSVHVITLFAHVNDY